MGMEAVCQANLFFGAKFVCGCKKCDNFFVIFNPIGGVRIRAGVDCESNEKLANVGGRLMRENVFKVLNILKGERGFIIVFGNKGSGKFRGESRKKNGNKMSRLRGGEIILLHFIFENGLQFGGGKSGGILYIDVVYLFSPPWL